MKKLKYMMGLALLLMLGVLTYYMFVNRDKDDDSNNEQIVESVDKVLAMDLENNYPKTAREVVLYFTNIQKCYYNEEYSEDELKELSNKAMKLFDDKLVEANEFDEYYENLGLEIDEYETAQRTISKVILDKASDVLYSEIDGVRYAQMNCIYYLKTSGETIKVTETYALRCDADGNWKILGWSLYTPSEYEQ